MTKKYYQASFGNLLLLGDLMVVNIKQSAISSGSFSSYILVRATIDFINSSGGLNTIYNHNKLLDYDFYTASTIDIGLPKPVQPNGKIDFIQILIRNSSSTYGGLKNGQGQTGASLYDMFDRKLLIGQSYYDSDGVSIQAIDCGNSLSTLANNIVVHEYSHNLLGDNGFHTSGGHHYRSSTNGWFISLQGGHGLMGGSNTGLTSCNGYERWRLGWTNNIYNPKALPIAANNLLSDITKSDGDKSYILRDFVKTGDAIRIKLPYVDAGSPNQYIWLENHQILSENIDQLIYYDGINCRDRGSSGIYAYMQIGKDIIDGDLSLIYPYGQADNLRIISAEGFWDYSYVGNNANCVGFGPEHTLQYKRENPLSGEQDQEIHRNPYSVTYLSESYNTGNKYLNNRNFVGSLPYLGDRYDAFNGNSIIDIGTNPSTTNMSTFYSFDLLKDYSVVDSKKIYLNGLKINMINLGNGTYQVNISWNNYQVKNNVNWAGNISLKEQVDLMPYQKMYLEQSYSPIQTYLDPVSQTFAPPTVFDCESGSVFHAEANSSVEVNSKSTFILESNSTAIIENGAGININSGSTLKIKNGANLIIKGNGNISISSGAYICVEPGANITLQDVNSVINLHNGYINCLPNSNCSSCSNILTFPFSGLGKINLFNTDQYIQNILFTSPSYISGNNIYAGTNVTNTKPQGPVIVKNGFSVVFDADGNNILERGFEVEKGGSFEAK